MRLVRFLFVLAVTTVTFSLGSLAQEKNATPKEIPDFDVQGISMTECQCTAYMCPCRSNGHPDHGSCDAADFVWIKSGHYGKVDMSGFKAVMIGDVIDADASKVEGTVYFDEKATPEQRTAYSEMMGFMFGWNPPNVRRNEEREARFRRGFQENGVHAYNSRNPRGAGRHEARQKRKPVT